MPALTPVEIAWQEGNDRKHEGAGFHLTFTFPDGSIVDAPPYDVGPNWAKLAELRDTPFMLDVEGAEVEVNWMPGQAYAKGDRFAFLQAPAPSPR